MHKRIIYILLLWTVLLGCVGLQAADWRLMGSEMLIPVSGGQAIAHNGLIYIIGGYSDSTFTPIDAIQCFNPQDSSWALAGHLQIPRANFVAGIYQNAIYVFGGRTGYGEDAVREVERWPFSGDAEIVSDKNSGSGRIDAAGWVHGAELFLFGGYGANSEQMPYFRRYDIAKDTTTAIINPFGNQILYQQSAVFHENQFYLFGGVLNGIGRRILKYDIASQNLSEVSLSLYDPRAASSAVISNDGVALVIGGYNETDPALASVEQLSFKSIGIFRDDYPPLNEPRTDLMAVLMESPDTAQVYVFGGKNMSGRVVGTVEHSFLRTENTGIDDFPGKPKTFYLAQNYPNPFNSQTIITFSLEKQQAVRISVFDAQGRMVAELAEGVYSAGTHQVQWSSLDARGNRVVSGLYFCQLVTLEGTLTPKNAANSMKKNVFNIMIWVLLSASVSFPQVISRDLSRLEEKLKRFDYNGVIVQSDSLLHDQNDLSKQERTQVLAFKGIAQYSKGDTEMAFACFADLLNLAPDYQLDPVQTSPKIIAFFEEIRQRLEMPDLAPRDVSPVKTDTVTVVFRSPNLLKKAILPSLLLPGTGHLVAGNKRKALILTPVSAAVLGLTIYSVIDCQQKENTYLRQTQLHRIHSTYQDYDSAYQRRNVLLAAYTALWSYSQIDLVLWTGRQSDTRLTIQPVIFDKNTFLSCFISF